MPSTRKLSKKLKQKRLSFKRHKRRTLKHKRKMQRGGVLDLNDNNQIILFFRLMENFVRSYTDPSQIDELIQHLETKYQFELHNQIEKIKFQHMINSYVNLVSDIENHSGTRKYEMKMLLTRSLIQHINDRNFEPLIMPTFDEYDKNYGVQKYGPRRLVRTQHFETPDPSNLVGVVPLLERIKKGEM